jgi:hypothetical protein
MQTVRGTWTTANSSTDWYAASTLLICGKRFPQSNICVLYLTWSGTFGTHFSLANLRSRKGGVETAMTTVTDHLEVCLRITLDAVCYDEGRVDGRWSSLFWKRQRLRAKSRGGLRSSRAVCAFTPPKKIWPLSIMTKLWRCLRRIGVKFQVLLGYLIKTRYINLRAVPPASIVVLPHGVMRT